MMIKESLKARMPTMAVDQLVGLTIKTKETNTIAKTPRIVTSIGTFWGVLNSTTYQISKKEKLSVKTGTPASNVENGSASKPQIQEERIRTHTSVGGVALKMMPGVMPS